MTVTRNWRKLQCAEGVAIMHMHATMEEKEDVGGYSFVHLATQTMTRN